jgi:hypothetical protein
MKYTIKKMFSWSKRIVVEYMSKLAPNKTRTYTILKPILQKISRTSLTPKEVPNKIRSRFLEGLLVKML